MKDAREEYADIIDRERPVSNKRQPMERVHRAAQFAPFAALIGYEDLICEAESDTEKRVDEEVKKVDIETC